MSKTLSRTSSAASRSWSTLAPAETNVSAGASRKTAVVW